MEHEHVYMTQGENAEGVIIAGCWCGDEVAYSYDQYGDVDRLENVA